MVVRSWVAVTVLFTSFSSWGATHRITTRFSDADDSTRIEYTLNSQGFDEVRIITARHVEILPAGKVSILSIDQPSLDFEKLEAFKDQHKLKFNIFPIMVKGNSGAFVGLRVNQEYRTYLILENGQSIYAPSEKFSERVSWEHRIVDEESYLFLSTGNTEGDAGALFLMNLTREEKRRLDTSYHDIAAISSQTEIDAMGGLATVPSLHHTFDLKNFQHLQKLEVHGATPYLGEGVTVSISGDGQGLPLLRMAPQKTELQFQVSPALYAKLLNLPGLTASERLADLKRLVQKEYPEGFYWARFPGYNDRSRYNRLTDQFMLLPRRERAFRPIVMGLLDSRPQLFEEPWNSMATRVIFDPDFGETTLTAARLLMLPNPLNACGSEILLQAAG